MKKSKTSMACVFGVVIYLPIMIVTYMAIAQESMHPMTVIALNLSAIFAVIGIFAFEHWRDKDEKI